MKITAISLIILLLSFTAESYENLYLKEEVVAENDLPFNYKMYETSKLSLLYFCKVNNARVIRLRQYEKGVVSSCDVIGDYFTLSARSLSDRTVTTLYLKHTNLKADQTTKVDKINSTFVKNVLPYFLKDRLKVNWQEISYTRDRYTYTKKSAFIKKGVYVIVCYRSSDSFRSVTLSYGDYKDTKEKSGDCGYLYLKGDV